MNTGSSPKMGKSSGLWKRSPRPTSRGKEPYWDSSWTPMNKGLEIPKLPPWRSRRPGPCDYYHPLVAYISPKCCFSLTYELELAGARVKHSEKVWFVSRPCPSRLFHSVFQVNRYLKVPGSSQSMVVSPTWAKGYPKVLRGSPFGGGFRTMSRPTASLIRCWSTPPQ